ncbi:acetamidase [Candidatus Bathyarchaeota archaeon]|nr:MAG: acetamidase [Candidatus Bathyarchaeota archaeon]
MVRRIERKPWEDLDPMRDSTLGPYTPPIATVRPGEVVEIETWDAFGGVVVPGQTYAEAVARGIKLHVNPVTGPIEVEGAEPGDTLVVEILDIELPERGATAIIPGFGALEGWLRQLEPRTKFSRISGGKVVYVADGGEAVEIDVAPFIGTIGVSPESEAITTISPGPHGGNMDCPDVRPGNRLMLPVSRPGALFGLGDVHAVQGDGEICGTAVEVPAVVTLRFDILKGRRIGWPRVESEEEIMTVCSARPLEDAARLAYRELVDWMAADYGWNRMDAYMFLSLAARARIAQIVDPLYTVVAKLPKRYLERQA